MYGVGGVVGAFTGGMATQYDHPMLVFWIIGGVGVCISLVSLSMSKNLESNAESIINMTFKERIKNNWREIKKGFKIREYHRALYFFIILGAVVPSFSEYFYYYMSDVTGITKFQYAMLRLIGYVCMFSGAAFHAGCMKTSEIRYTMVLACFINLVGAVTCLMFVKNIMLGMSPFIFLIFSDAVTEVLYVCFVTLPSQVIFAKMIPSTIEASMFAISTGLTNFANLYACKQLGNIINIFVGVGKENMEDLWKLYIYQAGMCMIPLLFLWLLPTRKQVENVQKVIQFMEKEESSIVSEGEREISIKDLDPNVALRMGVINQYQAAKSITTEETTTQ